MALTPVSAEGPHYLHNTYHKTFPKLFKGQWPMAMKKTPGTYFRKYFTTNGHELGDNGNPTSIGAPGGVLMMLKQLSTYRHNSVNRDDAFLERHPPKSFQVGLATNLIIPPPPPTLSARVLYVTPMHYAGNRVVHMDQRRHQGRPRRWSADIHFELLLTR